jgi:hypothetical protein
MTNLVNKIITGERIQQLAQIYIGYSEDFDYNPVIKNQKNKQKLITSITEPFNNPYIIFIYTRRYNEFFKIIHFFINPFILISHNCDVNVYENTEVLRILNYNKLVKWYTQNLCFKHEKINILPIGLANSQWPHGNLSLFNNENFVNSLQNKSKKVFFNFSINTNPVKRQICYDILSKKIPWLNFISPNDNLIRMKDYEFCICPEGNGIDCHRFWEALYLKCVPIVVNSPFIDILNNMGIPMLILNNWEELDINTLDYNKYKFREFTITDFIKL